jgi:hypothetical protein
MEVIAMRLQIDLDEAGVRTLNDLKRRTGLKTHKDLFNNALALLDWATRQVVEGRVVASVDPRNESYRELEMPALHHARAVNAGSDDARDLQRGKAAAS